jgi:hypothetical protein
MFLAGGEVVLANLIVSSAIKWLAGKAVDYATLGAIKDAYNRLPDKRRRPGPKLRRLIHMLESGAAREVRAELKDISEECLSSNVSELIQLGNNINDALCYAC